MTSPYLTLPLRTESEARSQLRRPRPVAWDIGGWFSKRYAWELFCVAFLPAFLGFSLIFAARIQHDLAVEARAKVQEPSFAELLRDRWEGDYVLRGTIHDWGQS